MNTGFIERRVAAFVHTSWALVLAVGFVLPGGPAEADQDPTVLPSVLTLDWCLERAHAANPTLAASAASADAAMHRILPAGRLEDPRVAYEASNLPLGDFDFESTPLSGHQLGLRQKLPFPGLLSNRRSAEGSASKAADWLVDDQTRLLEGAVETAWAELGYAQRALEITRRNIELLRQLATTAESRYRVGNGLQQDVLRAQVELTALLQEKLRREETIQRAEARLTELLDLPPDTGFPTTDSLRLTTPEPDLPPILERLEEGSARLRAAAERVEEARLRIRVAELEGMPDVDLGIGYRIRKDVVGDPVDGDDFVSAGVTLRLPVDRSKWRARVAEQRSNLRRAEAELRRLRASLEAEVRSAHAGVRRATAEEALLETGLVPQARQSLESSRSAYEVGRIEFLSLLDSQVRLLDAELRLVRARADRRRAFAVLETASGEKLR